MLRPKRAMLVCPLLVAFGLVNAAVASAEATPSWIQEKNVLLAPIEGKVTKVQFFIKDENPAVKFTVLCEVTSATSSIGAEWNSKLGIEFKNCSVVEQPTCTVEEPILVKLSDQLVYKEPGIKGETAYDVFYPEGGKFTGSTFAKIKVLGCCQFAGTYEIKGSAIATLAMPEKAKQELVKVEVKFKGAASPTGEYENKATGLKEKAGELSDNGSKAYLEGEVLQELAKAVGYE